MENPEWLSDTIHIPMRNDPARERNSVWVLMAVIYGGGENGAGVDSIVSAADYVNHAIINYTEYQEGINFLIRKGIISWKPNGFQLTDGIVKEIRRIKSKGIRKYWVFCERVCEEGSNTPDVASGNPDFTASREEFEEVVRNYLRRNQQ
jgi:hypothetical protein